MIFLVLLFPSIYGNNHTQIYYNIARSLPSTLDCNVANDEVKAQFDVSNMHIVMMDRDMDSKQKKKMMEEIGNVKGVKSTISMSSLLGPTIPESMIPENLRSMLQSDEYELAFVSSEYESATDEVNEQVKAIDKIVKSYDKDGMVIGEAPLMKDLQDVTDVLRESGFAVFKSAVEAGGSVRLINAKGLAGALTRKEIDKLVDVAKTYGAKGLAYTRLTADGVTSSFEKFLSEEEKAALHKAAGAETGDVLLVVADAKNSTVFAALGALRLAVANKCGLIDPDKFNFLWVTDFPFFEYSEEEGRWMAMHHPFTMPRAEDLDKVESDPGSVRALAYDMVLNGCELGGGSIRINDPAVQDRMLKALGFSEERARESFGFLMDAYQYGAPPHGGMAFGFDRMVMLMLKRDSIRDVIAFPKVQNAGEPMSGCPETVEEKQLRELSIAYAPIETEE